MTTAEILSLIGAIISFIALIILILLLFNKNKNQDLNLVENTIIDKVKDMETAMTKSIHESMLNFNNLVNEQLRNQSKSSSDSITDFRLNVNKELANFQSKINDDLKKDFSFLNENIEKKMFEINDKVEDRLSKGFKDTNETFNQIVKRVEVIDEAQKRIKDLSEEMVSLQNILSNNQARGSFGEYQLNQLLVSLFGENKKLYDIQYTLKKNKTDVVRADAVIFMPEPKGLIAIDSKFPYSSYSKLFDNKELTKEEENKIIIDFGREVKKHITDISSKYIIPGMTTDYAIMFVPSDGILAMIHSKLPAVVEYARNKNITIVSPTTLIPLLSSFQSMVIDYERSKHINEIIVQLKKLKVNFNNFEGEWAKLNRSIDMLRKDGDKVNNRVEKITTRFKDIDKVNFIEGEREPSGDDTE
ncbi:MAG: DNA recombination protein RmuC [Tenericutes bacterium]|nr:DNA recombination protein RmuC [Mycoplasmatota bacterium]